jgi:hypothetical protein
VLGGYCDETIIIYPNNQIYNRRWENMLKKLIVITAIVFLGISCATGNGDGNNGKGDGNKGNNVGKMGSGGDWLTPNMASGGHYPNFPWYSSDVSFYSQGYSEITFSPFTEYYISSGMPVVGGIISTPVKFDITQKTPSEIYYGTGQALPYSQYVTSVPSRTNELWVQGATNWTQYVVSPVGTWLQLVAYAPVEGPTGFYEIVQTDTNTLKYKTYQFYAGYNTMNFNADQVGRHMLYFVVNNQPSNVVVVDVFAEAQPGSMPPSTSPVVSYGGQILTGPPQYTPQPTPGLASGDVSVTIKSNGMRGYDVYVDEVYIGKETSGDGSFSFRVKGNMYHDIRVFDGQFNYPKRIYFQSGESKIINVEPGTAVYI